MTTGLAARITEERDALIEAIVTERAEMAEAIAADYAPAPEEPYEEMAFELEDSAEPEITE